MKRKKSDNKIIIIIVLIFLVIGLTTYIIVDKVMISDEVKFKASLENVNNDESTQDDNTTNSEEEVVNNNETNNSILTENEVRQLMITYIKEKHTNVIDYRINSISFENNTKEFKDMIHEDQEHVLVYVDYDLIRDGNGYTKEQGWIKSNQEHCIFVKDSSDKYYVEKCGSGW